MNERVLKIHAYKFFKILILSTMKGQVSKKGMGQKYIFDRLFYIHI